MKFAGLFKLLTFALFASFVLADIDKTAYGVIEGSGFDPVMLKGGHGGGGSSGGGDSGGSSSGGSSSGGSYGSGGSHNVNATDSAAPASFTAMEGPVKLQTVLIALSVIALAQDFSRRIL